MLFKYSKRNPGHLWFFWLTHTHQKLKNFENQKLSLIYLQKQIIIWDRFVYCYLFKIVIHLDPPQPR